jgi:tetratricopeptide (TPR) repeat protein
MKKPALVLALLFVVGICAVAYLLIYRDGDAANSPFGAPSPPRDTAFDSELRQIRVAEKIEDPVQRCLAYPDPSEFHWDHEQVEQLCKKLAWRMLSWNEIRQLLDDHHPEKLDAAFDSYLNQNFDDPQRHGFLTWTFWWTFQNPSAEETALTQRWVDADPSSAYALAARGIHYSQAAYAARGGNSFGKTSDDQLSRMQEFVDKARADLEKSLSINPRLIAAYHGLLRIYRLSESKTPREDWVHRALALDAADPWIYEDWIDSTEPQWGGSTIEMEHIADEAATHAKENPLLATLKAEPLCNQGDDFRCTECTKDGAKALDFYKQAGGFGPSGCFLDGAGAAAVFAQDSQSAVRYYSQAVRFIGGADWFAYRAQALRSIGENEWAIRDLDKAIAANPRNTTALYSQGLIFTSMQRFGDAESTYRKILTLDPDHQNATIALSMLYLSESTPLYAPEKARPLVVHLVTINPSLAQAWLLKAAICWIDHDAPAYIEAGENYLKFVDHDDPANQNDIATIQKQIEQARQYQKAQNQSPH